MHRQEIHDEVVAPTTPTKAATQNSCGRVPRRFRQKQKSNLSRCVRVDSSSQLVNTSRGLVTLQVVAPALCRQFAELHCVSHVWVAPLSGGGAPLHQATD